ncbi:MAG: hypothetical protein RL041_1268, partial [Bacteroidota bacterium]
MFGFHRVNILRENLRVMKKIFALLTICISLQSLLAQSTISVRINSANDDYE